MDVPEAMVPPTGRISDERFFQCGVTREDYDVLVSRDEGNPYWILAISGAFGAVVEFASYFLIAELVHRLGVTAFWEKALSLGPWFYTIPFILFGLVFAVMQFVAGRRRTRGYLRTLRAIEDNIEWTAGLPAQDKKLLRRLERLYARIESLECETWVDLTRTRAPYQDCLHAMAEMIAVPPLTSVQRAIMVNDPNLGHSPALALANEFRFLHARRKELRARTEAALDGLKESIVELEKQDEALQLLHDAEQLWLDREARD